MNIIYLTTDVTDEDFNKASHKPNPAGQNFHGKLIHALSLYHLVHVYSVPPSVLGITEAKYFSINGNLSYSYQVPPKNKYVRAIFYPNVLASAIVKERGHDDDLAVIYDSLNLTIAKTALLVARKLGCPAVTVLTDDIRNITGVRPSYAKRILSLNKKAGGCIALTQGLVDVYGIDNKAYVQPILVEETKVEAIKRDRPYIYYGGALFIKDGTKDLIDAFGKYESDYDLVIAGHGDYEAEVAAASKANKRIIYLGQISKQDHYSYIAGAALCINPRHYNASLDSCAVPSKVMEYLTFGQAVASTKSTSIQEAFPDDVTWIPGSMDEFFAEHLQDGKLVNLNKNNAKTRIISEFGLEATGKKLSDYLTSLIHE